MVARRFAGILSITRLLALTAVLPTGLACVGTNEGATRVVNWGPREGSKPAEGDTINLPEAEQMIDELDRIMTANGTISVKTPDVWGQDRLAKFRSEYESQMAGWLKTGFKGDINASVRRSECGGPAGAGRGAGVVEHVRQAGLGRRRGRRAADVLAKTLAGIGAAEASSPDPAEKASVALEPTVVLDEHSNYLNHLNQLRRINAGDDLTDRPGYGLYLVRIPVTLSPGPKSRRGKGAIITVSARSLMTKHTLRNTLRNAVINETVNNLTQAICNQSCKASDRSSGPGGGSFSLVAYADTELFYGARNIGLLRERGRAPARTRPRRRASPPELPASPTGSEESSRRPITSSRKRRRPLKNRAETRPRPIRSKSSATCSPASDFARMAPLQPRHAGDPQVMRAGGPVGPAGLADPGSRRREIQSTPRLRPPHPGGRRESPAEAGHGRPGLQRQGRESEDGSASSSPSLEGGLSRTSRSMSNASGPCASMRSSR